MVSESKRLIFETDWFCQEKWRNLTQIFSTILMLNYLLKYLKQKENQFSFDNSKTFYEDSVKLLYFST